MFVRALSVTLLLLAPALWAAQPSAPALRFVEPEEGAFVSDRVRLAVDIDRADAALVTAVTFYADGRQVCVAANLRRPSCEWDAGSDVKEHALRAVATLSNGERRVATRRTKGLVINEFSSVQIVQVTAVVTDDGRFVKGLKKEQFRIAEDGVAQTIQFFGAEETPLEVVIAIDVSGSMTPLLSNLKAALRAFVGALRSSDQVTIIGFNDGVYTLAARGGDLSKRLASIDKLRAWGATALYDAIRDSIGRLSRTPGRRALVLFTDGEDSASSSTLAQAEEAIGGSDVSVFLVGLNRGPKRNDALKIMARLAEPSGGRVLDVDNANRLQSQFLEVVQELSNQYLIGYQPSAKPVPGAWRTVKVELSNARGRVRSRQGYHVSGAQ